MARINVEQKALTDARFVRLGKLALEGDVPEQTLQRAVGTLVGIHVWNVCQETGRYVLPTEELDAIGEALGVESASELVVLARLGVKHRQGVRIRGSKGRVEWLRDRRSDGVRGGVKGGRPPKRKRSQEVTEKPIGVSGPITPVGRPPETPPAPAPAPALSEPEGGSGDNSVAPVSVATASAPLPDQDREPARTRPDEPAAARSSDPALGRVPSTADLDRQRRSLRQLIDKLPPGSERRRLMQERVAEITTQLDARHPRHADGQPDDAPASDMLKAAARGAAARRT